MKLSKRDRYVLYWNGPDSLKHRTRVRRQCRAQMGHGDDLTRSCATAYVLRFRGKLLGTQAEFERAAGLGP